MPFSSPFPDLDIPKTDLISYLFPNDLVPSDKPLWIDSDDESRSLSPRQALQWIKRFAKGLDGLRVDPEVAHQIRLNDAKLILVHPTLVRTALAAVKEANIPNCQLYPFSDVEEASISGIEDWRSRLVVPAEADAFRFQRMTEEEATKTVAIVNYSSGTTGLPKGVCVSHYNMVANAEQAIYMRVSCLVYVMRRFIYEDFLRVIQKFSISSLVIAPPIMLMFSKRPETKHYDLSSIKDILCGGAPLSKELQNEISQKFKCQVYQGWGMTETMAAAIHVPVGKIDKTGSTGQLFPNTECKVLDDGGNEVAQGERGEMYLRGPQICMGYLKNKAATKETLSPDGWLKTGDIVVVRDGWFWIVDRKKELIKVNALQVAPAELEAVLLEHDEIADAVVVGIILDDIEWPRAYVHLKDTGVAKVTEDMIHRWMKERVAKYKQLVGGIAFVDEIPKLQSGKIMRKIVREWAKRDAVSMRTPPLAKL